jgi:hypothetical protein
MRYSGCAGRGWVLGLDVRLVRGLEVLGLASEAWDSAVVELKRRNGVESGCIRGKDFEAGKARRWREAPGAV